MTKNVLVGRRLTLVLTVLGYALPIAAYFWFISHYSVNVIYGDQWDDVNVLGHSYSGTLNLGTLWTQHSENRIFFPNLVVLALGYITHLNITIEEYLSGVMLVTAVGLLICAHKRRSPSMPWIAYCPVAILMLSFVQAGNSIWGFQMAWYLVLLSLAVALFLLDSPKLTGPRLLGAIGAAVVGSFSLFQGLLIWPVGLVILYLRRRQRAVMVAWVAAAVVTGAVYFINYSQERGQTYALHHPLATLKFFLYAIGYVVGPEEHGGKANQAVLLLGAIILVVAISILVFYAMRRGQTRGGPIGIALICFGLLFCASVTIGRVWGGYLYASFSRYTTFDLLILVGSYLALIDGSRLTRETVDPNGGYPAAEQSGVVGTLEAGRTSYSKAHRVGAAIVGACICAQVVLGLGNGLSSARYQQRSQQLAAQVLVNFEKYPNSGLAYVLYPFHSAANIRRLAVIAKAHKLSLFSAGA